MVRVGLTDLPRAAPQEDIAQHLEHEMAKDKIKRSMRTRPTKDELHDRNIYKTATEVKAERLRRSFAANTVSQMLREQAQTQPTQQGRADSPPPRVGMSRRANRVVLPPPITLYVSVCLSVCLCLCDRSMGRAPCCIHRATGCAE